MVKTTEVYCKIIDLDEEAVIMNCAIVSDSEDKILGHQVRRFDNTPFQDYIELKPGVFVILKITTKQGSQTFEFFPGTDDLRKYFPSKDEFFKDIDVSKLFDE